VEGNDAEVSVGGMTQSGGLRIYPHPPPDNLAAIWLSALDDAGIDPDDAVLIWRDGPAPVDVNQAEAWPRGEEIEAEVDGEELDERLAWANDDRHRDLRRVVVWTGRPDEALAALIRHELEHTQQFDEIGGERLRLLHGRAVEELRRHGGRTNRGYNAIPMERDANRAGAVFARRCYGDDRIDELVEENVRDVAALRATEPPEPLATLEQRMERFILEMDDEFVRSVEQNPVV
jgi:hypothetical protein